MQVGIDSKRDEIEKGIESKNIWEEKKEKLVVHLTRDWR